MVGPLENLFHALPGVEQYDRWGPEVLEALNEVTQAGKHPVEETKQIVAVGRYIRVWKN